jgi:hypothetical protein
MTEKKEYTINELFDAWKAKMEPEVQKVSDKVRRLTLLMVDSKTKECMDPTELRAFSEGDAEVREQYKEHYDSCQKYCQPAIKILTEE